MTDKMILESLEILNKVLDKYLSAENKKSIEKLFDKTMAEYKLEI